MILKPTGSRRGDGLLPFLVMLCTLCITNSWQPQLGRIRHLHQDLRRLSKSPSCLMSVSGGSGNNNPEDPVLRLPLMEAELATLDTDKDPSDLKTAIGDAKTAAEFGVRKSQLEFYQAFSAGDFDAMERVWSTESHVRCVHPGIGSLEGRETVMNSWKQIFASGGEQFAIEPARVQIDICGLTAICSCVEKTEGGGELEALNIYKREENTWKMILHMAGPVVMKQGGSGLF